MATDIVMPHMGESVAEGTILTWLKKPGDAVREDEPVVEISTDKINVEVPAAASGVLLTILANVGDTVQVNQRIGVIGQPGENAQEGAPPSKSVKPPAAPARPAEPPVRKPPAAPTQSTGGQAASGTRPPAAESSDGKQPVAPSAANDSTEPGVLNVLASPAVRRLAREMGVHLAEVRGSGNMGRITREDVQAWAARLGHEAERAAAEPEPIAPHQAAAATGRREKSGESAAAADGGQAEVGEGEPAAPARREPPQPGADEELVPLSPMRRAIAEHMSKSVREAPHVTTVAEVDMTAVARLRDQWKAAGRDSAGDANPDRPAAAGGAEEAGRGKDAKFTYTVFIASAVARALKEYPDLNASWTDGGILLKHRINIGLAVAVGEGLVVPVIRDADRLTLAELARAVQRIAEKTRAGKIAPSDIGGGTFTITNPGVFGAVLSTPIIHQPQAAILATGRVADVPAVVNGGIFIRKRMYLSLSYDHRVVDGATAVKFLQRVREILEEAGFKAS